MDLLAGSYYNVRQTGWGAVGPAEIYFPFELVCTGGEGGGGCGGIAAPCGIGMCILTALMMRLSLRSEITRLSLLSITCRLQNYFNTIHRGEIVNCLLLGFSNKRYFLC